MLKKFDINKKVIWIVLGLLTFVLVGCGSNETVPDTKEETVLLETPYDTTEFLMGTYVSLRIYDEGKEEVLDLAVERISELADKITTNEPDSEIDAVNEAAGEESVKVSEDVFPLLKMAADYSAVSKSGFDYTIGPVTDLWRIGFDDARVPEREEIQEVLPLVNHTWVELNTETNEIFLQETSMKIDLGAIAKGYIADEVKKIFIENGVTTAIIDLGGNVVVMGDSPTRDSGGFNVGVQDPFDSRGTYVAALNLRNQSIVTSGVYERYIEQDGVMYHHLMNPVTGYPFENELASVTIISEDSVDGDALSTIAFGFGLVEGLEYVNNYRNVEGVFITKNREVYTTDGLSENFSLTNDEYDWLNP